MGLDHEAAERASVDVSGAVRRDVGKDGTRLGDQRRGEAGIGGHGAALVRGIGNRSNAILVEWLLVGGTREVSQDRVVQREAADVRCTTAEVDALRPGAALCAAGGVQE